MSHRSLDGVAGIFPAIDWLMDTNYDTGVMDPESSVVTMRWLLATHLLRTVLSISYFEALRR